MRTRILAILLAAATLMLSASAVAAGNWETADVIGQGFAGPVVAPGGAAIQRTPNGVAASLTMATPAPGTYTYFDGPTGNADPGHPEAFSLWVFIFYNPEACTVPFACGPGDLMNKLDVVAGAHNAGGHLVSSPDLHLSGYVNKSSFTFGGGNAETIGQAVSMGYDLASAEIHLAVAPHGSLDPTLLPEAISTPNGMPPHWWLAFFDPQS